MSDFNVRDLMDRIKNMQYYQVVIPLEEDIEFNGPVPFDIKINKDKIAQFNILASNYEEAERKAWDFINGNGNEYV